MKTNNDTQYITVPKWLLRETGNYSVDYSKNDTIKITTNLVLGEEYLDQDPKKPYIEVAVRIYSVRGKVATSSFDYFESLENANEYIEEWTSSYNVTIL